jgi:hypothetical protein
MTFPERYWCRHGLVVTVDGPLGLRSTTVERPFARISTRRGAEIVLPDLKIASRGLYLHATDAGVFCLGFSHAETTEEPWRGWLRPDQVVPLGPYQISARLTGSAGAPPQRPPDLANLDEKGSAAEPYPIIAVSFGGHEVARRRLSRSLTVIGRLRPSALPIHSNDLSASHLVLYWNAGTLWVIDLLSRMGTVVEGAPIQCAELPLGCSLTVGEVSLRYAELYSSRRGKPSDGSADYSLELASAEVEAGRSGGDPAILAAPEALAAPEPPPAIQAIAPNAPIAPPDPAAPETPLEPRVAAPVVSEAPAAPIEEQLQRLQQVRAELEARERSLRGNQESWVAEQQKRERQWQKRAAELAEKQTALAAQHQQQRAALEEERRALRAEFDGWKASADRLRAELARQQEEFVQRQQEFQLRHQEWVAERARCEAEAARRREAEAQEDRRRRDVEAERLALEEQRCRAIEAERQLLEERVRRLQGEVERLQAEARRQELESDRAAASIAAAVRSSTDPVAASHQPPSPEPKDVPGPPTAATSAAGRLSPEAADKLDTSYDEVLDRLMLVSRQRSSWLYRLRGAWDGMRGWLAQRFRPRRSEGGPEPQGPSPRPG